MITETFFIKGSSVFHKVNSDACKGALFGDLIRFGVPLECFYYVKEVLIIANAKIIFLTKNPGPPLLTADYKKFTVN